ncbi:17.1 kDa class II heat shock protein-like [Typha angustifolia]|uniref:17.1 kDa class II heat shock protein-like n=1 Tax=Typha angustifolia TaxID=59011 RepID=UPI003C2D77FA
MDVVMGLDDPFFSALQHLMEVPEEMEKAFNAPTRAYVRDRKAMANTPMDIKELPSGTIVLTVDMPGVNPGEVKVQVEEGNVLVISGERKMTEDKEGKYLRMERRMGKFMRKFPLPENANLESITAAYRDGVLTVTVEKKPPPEPKKPRTVEVRVG